MPEKEIRTAMHNSLGITELLRYAAQKSNIRTGDRHHPSSKKHRKGKSQKRRGEKMQDLLWGRSDTDHSNTPKYKGCRTPRVRMCEKIGASGKGDIDKQNLENRTRSLGTLVHVHEVIKVDVWSHVPDRIVISHRVCIPSICRADCRTDRASSCFGHGRRA